MENEEKKAPVVPTVGMPATYCIGSDRYAGQIVQVAGRTIGFQEEGATRVEVFSLRKNGRWYKTGFPVGKGGSLRLGVAENYQDPSF